MNSNGGVITAPQQVTAQWLTTVLVRDGALTAGRVTAVESESDSGNWSANATLSLRYSEDARGSLPDRLFLKMVNTDLEDESFGDSEVTYYMRDYVDVADAPLLRCYDAAYSQAEQCYHLLLQDVTATHVVGWKKGPSLGYVQALADGLAAMHAHWWGSARLAQAQMPVHDAAHIRRFVQIAEAGVAHILQRFSAELEAHWPQLIQTIYARHPQAIVQRAAAGGSGFTLIHGDAGPHNILVPQQGDRPLYIIDRQPFNWSLTSWLGVYDLVYATLFDWAPQARRELELPLLRRYHEQLISRGVRDYSLQQLWDDYRLCVPMGVYVATEYCRGGVNESFLHVWLPMLKRALVACEELRCSELW
jgi:hypothetical protein